MLVLFTTQPAAGHFHPQVPLARALTVAGHEVAFACAPAYCAMIEASGFRCFPAGLDWIEAEAERAFPGLLTVPEGREQAAYFMTRVFAGEAARRMVPDLLALARGWPPDVIAHDPVEYGGPVAADLLGLPYAAAGAPVFPPPALLDALVGVPLAALRERHGLPPAPDPAWLSRYLVLAAMAPSLLLPWRDVVPPTTHFLRPVPFDRTGDEGLPSWVAHLPARPTVYATLGTINNRQPALFRAILDALGDVAANLVVTVGRTLDPAQFGPQRPGVHVARYIPQSALLPRCDLVITHGGVNTVLGALAQGLPLVVIPLGADQFTNAERARHAGVGWVVGPDERTPEAIRAAVLAVLADPAYRRNAARLRDELAALPGPEHGVALLERLARERAPIGAR